MLKQRNNAIKVCRECGVELVIGENWTQTRANQRDYICRRCHAAYRQRDNPNYKPPQLYNTIKVCRVCGVELTAENWPDANKKDRRYHKCRQCHNVDLRPRRQRHNRKMRAIALARYGGCCACCGEKRTEFLAMDHINGGGRKERKEKHYENVSYG